MTAIKIISIWGLCSIVCAVLASYFAIQKNRDYSFWAAWSFIVPPALLVLILLPSRKLPPPRRPSLDEEDAAQY